ncbi:pyridoxal phosphate-dependent transferase [Peziza echinospora]|nr:pyridoxal phosphate-dependent transferase [Peziza echinospora]
MAEIKPHTSERESTVHRRFRRDQAKDQHGETHTQHYHRDERPPEERGGEGGKEGVEDEINVAECEFDEVGSCRKGEGGGWNHKAHALDTSRSSTGVIWTTERAYALGYEECPNDWGNLGQGAPEVEDIPHSFHRPTELLLPIQSREYGPVSGITPLRKAVANLYNSIYRVGKESQYTYENVCIVPGGRAGLIRIAAVIGTSYLSYFVPDYTAYNEMLGVFRGGFVAVPVVLKEEEKWRITPEMVQEEIRRGVSVVLTSNPRNPAGMVVKGEELKKIQTVCRNKATLVMDEFYSGYYYGSGCDGSMISAAENVEDVDTDDVLIIDGLTKNFRLPGWRIAWVIGPKTFIKAIGSCGSYLDGGANVPFQEEAVKFLDPVLMKNEMKALQRHFKDKRDYVVGRFEQMGFCLKYVPDSTFYIWLDVSRLPPPINHGLGFFEECLQEKVIVVPGIFFDINPSKRRELFDSPCHRFVRVSYGPRMDILEKGMDGIQRVLKKHGFEGTKTQSEDEFL